jgi:hypothetical protein
MSALRLLPWRCANVGCFDLGEADRHEFIKTLAEACHKTG